MTGLQDNKNLHRLSPIIVRNSDGNRLGDFRVFVEDLFNLARINAEAAGNDHVFLAIHDKDLGKALNVVLLRSDYPFSEM